MKKITEIMQKIKSFFIKTMVFFLVMFLVMIIGNMFTSDANYTKAEYAAIKVEIAQFEGKINTLKNTITDQKSVLESTNFIKYDTRVKEEARIIADKKAAAEKAAADKAAADKIAADLAVAKKLAEEKAAKEYQSWISNQFSIWNGSHTALVSLVKDNLNDAKSFQHVSTVYTDHGTYIIVFMVYRAKNAFNATILQNVTAKAVYATNMISIISTND